MAPWHNGQESDVINTLIQVHKASNCIGRHCVIHNPSNHPMRQMPLHWRDDRKIFERICPCGIGHPDPDMYVYWRIIGRESEAVHGCCGQHCWAPEVIESNPLED